MPAVLVFVLWCSVLAVASYFRTRDSYVEENDRVRWHRLGIAALLCFALLAAMTFLLMIPKDQGHPPLAALPLMFLPMVLAILVSVACWMLGRQLGLEAARKRQ